MLMLQAIINNFLTVQELTNVKNIIENLYTTLIENDTTGVLIPFIRTDLEAMKNQTIAILNSEVANNNVFQTGTIQLEKVIPASVLSHELYGEYINNEDDLETYKDILTSLNSSQPMHAFQPGPVTVVII